MQKLSYYEYCEIARHAGIRIPDDAMAYLKDQVLCTYVGKMTQTCIFWSRRDSNMPDVEREDVLFRSHLPELMRILEKRYPGGMVFFEKDYATIAADLEEFRIELMNAKLIFALWDSVRYVRAF